MYKYLGIVFSQSRSFVNARKQIAEQEKKALYLLLCRINNLNLPFDLQLKIFDQTTMPILTYGSEIFGFENLALLDKIHIKILKNITKCKRSKPSYIIYAELGRYQLGIVVKSRIIEFWNRILLDKPVLIYNIPSPENSRAFDIEVGIKR